MVGRPTEVVLDAVSRILDLQSKLEGRSVDGSWPFAIDLLAGWNVVHHIIFAESRILHVPGHCDQT